MLFAVFMAVAMVSFFVKWPSHENVLGTVGYHLSALLVQNTFGIASFGFSFLLFLFGLHLWKVNPLPLKRTSWVTLFWMVWFSTVLGYIAEKFLTHSPTIGNYVGVTGNFIAESCDHLIKWGTLVLFGFLAIVVLIFIHKVKIHPPKVNIDLDKIKSIIPAPKPKESQEAEPTEAEVPAPSEPSPNPQRTQQTPAPETLEKVTFSIDDEFARINQRAQSSKKDIPEAPPSSDITFNIEDTQSHLPDAPQEEEQAHYSEFETVHTSHHYTVDRRSTPSYAYTPANT